MMQLDWHRVRESNVRTSIPLLECKDVFSARTSSEDVLALHRTFPCFRVLVTSQHWSLTMWLIITIIIIITIANVF